MYKKLADGRVAVKIENDNQIRELKNICKKDGITVCRMVEENKDYPWYYSFVEILGTGAILLAPSSQKHKSWSIMEFKKFKKMALGVKE